MSWDSADVKDWLSRSEPESVEEQVMLLNALMFDCASNLYTITRENKKYLVWGCDALTLDDEEDLIRLTLIIHSMELDIGKKDFDEEYAFDVVGEIPDTCDWLKQKGFAVNSLTSEMSVPWKLRSGRLLNHIRSSLERELWVG